MNRYLVLISVFLAVAACKTQRTVAPIILKDSVSITYKQGQTLTPTLSLIGQGGQEQPASIDAQGAAIESRKNSCVPADGSVGVGGATQGASVFEGLLSQRTNKPAVPPTTIRVDTVFIERWHTQTVPTPPPRGESVGATKFYKDCTKGFWILLIVLLGSFGFRILKAIYLRR